MAKIKLQLVAGKDHGDVSCDFRGEKFIGDAEGDHHSTVYTKNTTDESLILEALTKGVIVNQFFKKLFSGALFARVGVFDDNH